MTIQGFQYLVRCPLEFDIENEYRASDKPSSSKSSISTGPVISVVDLVSPPTSFPGPPHWSIGGGTGVHSSAGDVNCRRLPRSVGLFAGKPQPSITRHDAAAARRSRGRPSGCPFNSGRTPFLRLGRPSIKARGCVGCQSESRMQCAFPWAT